MERAALVLATTGLGRVVGFQEPALLRFWRTRPALDLAMPNWAATARTVTPLRNKATTSSRWLGFRSHANQVGPHPSGVDTSFASNGRPASPKWARLFST